MRTWQRRCATPSTRARTTAESARCGGASRRAACTKLNYVRVCVCVCRGAASTARLLIYPPTPYPVIFPSDFCLCNPCGLVKHVKIQPGKTRKKFERKCGQSWDPPPALHRAAGRRSLTGTEFWKPSSPQPHMLRYLCHAAGKDARHAWPVVGMQDRQANRLERLSQHLGGLAQQTAPMATTSTSASSASVWSAVPQVRWPCV